MGDSIKCLAIINLNNNQTIFLSSLRPSYIQYFSDELDNMLKTFQSLHSSKKEISKIHSNTGIWYCKLNNQKKMMFITLASLQYPFQSAIRMISDLEEEAKKIPDFEKKDLKTLLNNQALSLMKNYEKDPDFNDKFKNLEESIESISGLMGENIKKITANKEDLERMEKNTGEMNEMAGKFRNEATLLKRKMFWQQYTTWIVLGVVLAICLTVVFIIATDE